MSVKKGETAFWYIWRMGLKKIGIYIHIPFCTKRCIYCNFLSSRGGEQVRQHYFDALRAEAEEVFAGGMYGDVQADSIYFGGGTPSCADEQQIANVLDVIKKALPVSPNAEISMEGNPETLLLRSIPLYRDAGINRVSIGLQSASLRLLKFLGRAHSTADFSAAVQRLNAAGITNLNADILLGVPGQTVEDIKDAISFVCRQGIKHVSVYGLKAEKGTKLYKMIALGSIKMPGEDECADMYAAAAEELKSWGLYRYEVSNFSVPGYECYHNLKYWRRLPYAGLGASAHSFTGGIRYNNVASVSKYIAAAGSGFDSIRRQHIISAEEAEFEYIMLNLRLSRGIDTSEFKRLFGSDFKDKYKTVLKKYSQFFWETVLPYSGNARVEGISKPSGTDVCNIDRCGNTKAYGVCINYNTGAHVLDGVDSAEAERFGESNTLNADSDTSSDTISNIGGNTDSDTSNDTGGGCTFVSINEKGIYVQNALLAEFLPD